MLFTIPIGFLLLPSEIFLIPIYSLHIRQSDGLWLLLSRKQSGAHQSSLTGRQDMFSLNQSEQQPFFNLELRLLFSSSLTASTMTSGGEEVVISNRHTRVHSWSSTTPVCQSCILSSPIHKPGNSENRFPPTAAFKSSLARTGRETGQKSSWICHILDTNQKFQHQCDSPTCFSPHEHPCTRYSLVHDWGSASWHFNF